MIRQTWLDLAIETEDRLGMTPLESASYENDYEWSPEYQTDLIKWVSELQSGIYEEVESVEPSQRRSFLSATFAYLFQWEDI